jgi:hypothetical protein
MQTRSGMGLVKAVGAIVGVAVLGAGGFRLATGECLVGACFKGDSTGSKVTLVSGADSSDHCSLGGCTMESETVAYVTTEAAYFEGDEKASGECDMSECDMSDCDMTACDESGIKEVKQVKEGSCDKAKECDSTSVEQTASSAK